MRIPTNKKENLHIERSHMSACKIWIIVQVVETYIRNKLKANTSTVEV